MQYLKKSLAIFEKFLAIFGKMYRKASRLDNLIEKGELNSYFFLESLFIFDMKQDLER